MRTTLTRFIENPKDFKNKLLNWSQQFREVVFLDSNSYPQEFSNFDAILAVDAFTLLQTDFTNAFEDLNQYQQSTKDWLFGYLSYDLKNDSEALQSNNLDVLNFPDLFFFQPKKLFLLKENQLEIHYLMLCDDEIETDFDEINAMVSDNKTDTFSLDIQARVSKELYLDKVNSILQQLQRGDIYEANFCMEFFAENAFLNPFQIFGKLNKMSLSPFAAFLKNNDHFVLSASPERYLKKEGEDVISQPIKGTAKRFLDLDKDEESKNNLLNNPKERAENIMITDLVRNDLSKTAIKGSVQVKELCAVYSFEQVHQMISTISSKVDSITAAAEILKTTFPMGSMTGAPKVAAMKIIENFELTKRGVYSGAIGYFTPSGDFDFNVVIRSILYHKQKKYVSFSVGSAITAQSIPEVEYEECLLKAKAMRQVLT